MLNYTIHLTNGDHELPADEDGLTTVHFTATVGLLVVLVYAALGLSAQFAKFGQVHMSAAGVALALLLQFFACALEFVHLITYSRDGKGWRWRHGRLPLDFLSDTAQNLSETIVVVLVVSIGLGWTLIDGSTSRNIHRVWGLLLVVGALQFAVEVLSRKYEDDFSSFHDHDHWPGEEPYNSITVDDRCYSVLLHAAIITATTTYPQELPCQLPSW